MDKKIPLVTAIITTYKRDVEILERALKSIENQTYENMEIIIVNDYPNYCENNKKIKEMLKKYNNVKYIIVEKNGGACKARNIGINNSKGEYIGFLDDDDEWLPNKIEVLIKGFKNNKNIAICYGNSIIYNEDTNKENILYNKIMPSGKIYEQLLCSNFIGSCSYPIIKREALERVNGFNEEMPSLQDWELYLRIAKEYEVLYIDEVVTKYHKYDGERISKNGKKRVAGHEKLFSIFKEDIIKNKDALYGYYISMVNKYSVNRSTKKAFIALKNAIKTKPYKIKVNLKYFFKIIIRIFLDINNI